MKSVAPKPGERIIYVDSQGKQYNALAGDVLYGLRSLGDLPVDMALTDWFDSVTVDLVYAVEVKTPIYDSFANQETILTATKFQTLRRVPHKSCRASGGEYYILQSELGLRL